MDHFEAITAAEMRALEQAAILSGDVSGLELMERAGQGVVDAILREWPDLRDPRALVLCGPGNNGGDGFVVARLLHDLGWRVKLASTVGLNAMKGDAATNAKRWAATDAALTPYLRAGLAHELDAAGFLVVVDALLGIGQNRASDALLEPFLAAWDDMANSSSDNRVVRVSIDIPTGYDTDTGAQLAQIPFEPDLTVTFHRPKPVHLLLERQGYKVVVKDIGL